MAKNLCFFHFKVTEFSFADISQCSSSSMGDLNLAQQTKLKTELKKCARFPFLHPLSTINIVISLTDYSKNKDKIKNT